MTSRLICVGTLKPQTGLNLNEMTGMQYLCQKYRLTFGGGQQLAFTHVTNFS